jgi:hypothetical protein
MTPPNFTTLTVNYGSSSSVSVSLISGTYAGFEATDVIENWVKAGGVWTAGVFIPVGQITSIAAS